MMRIRVCELAKILGDLTKKKKGAHSACSESIHSHASQKGMSHAVSAAARVGVSLFRVFSPTFRETVSKLFSSLSLLVDPVVGLELEHLADGDGLPLVAQREPP